MKTSFTVTVIRRPNDMNKTSAIYTLVNIKIQFLVAVRFFLYLVENSFKISSLFTKRAGNLIKSKTFTESSDSFAKFPSTSHMILFIYSLLCRQLPLGRQGLLPVHTRGVI